jgi:energy-coupling factor transporter ATP-binding protein EcfA2
MSVEPENNQTALFQVNYSNNEKIIVDDKKRYFIITLGPTGSGKTTLVKATLTQLGLPENSEYTKFLIDDIVENDIDYKHGVRQIIEDIGRECLDNKDKCLEDAFNNPSPQLYDKFAEIYGNVRQGKNGLGCKTQIADGRGTNCSDVLNNDLKNISKTKPDIVVFESTGTYMPEWLLSREFIPYTYEVVISYSLVTIDNLVKRNQSRAYDSVKEFNNDKTTPAPRLPKVDRDTFEKLIKQIKNTLIEMYDSCVKSKYDKTCGTVRIDRLLLFDNNGTSHQNIYDSKPPDLDLGKINKSLGLTHIVGGKKRKSYRKKSKTKQYKKYF